MYKDVYHVQVHMSKMPSFLEMGFPEDSVCSGFGSCIDVGIQNTGGCLAEGRICWAKSSVNVQALESKWPG